VALRTRIAPARPTIDCILIFNQPLGACTKDLRRIGMVFQSRAIDAILQAYAGADARHKVGDRVALDFSSATQSCWRNNDLEAFA
jgi:hypothetical protein